MTLPDDHRRYLSAPTPTSPLFLYPVMTNFPNRPRASWNGLLSVCLLHVWVTFPAADSITRPGQAEVPLPQLRDELRSGNSRLQEKALQTLSKMGPRAKDAILDICELLQRENIEVKAAITLGELRENAAQAIPALVASLRSGFWVTRLYAADALGRIGLEPETCIPALTATLTEKIHRRDGVPIDGPSNDKVRVAAAKSLASFSHEAKSIAPVLTAVLDDAEENLSVRQGAAKALAYLAEAMVEHRDTRLVPELQKALRSMESSNFEQRLIGALRHPLDQLKEMKQSGVQAPLSESEALSAAEASRKLVVQIRGMQDEGLVDGTGIIFGYRGDRLYIMTAKHIALSGTDKLKNPRVRFRSLPGENLPAEITEHFNSDLDLAVLVVRQIQPANLGLEKTAWNRLGPPRLLKEGDSVYAIGLPEEQSGGRIAADVFAKAVGFQLTFESRSVRRGYSGGGLFDANWRLVGMIRADAPPNTTAVGIDQIIAQLQEWGYPVNLVSD